MNGFFWEVMTSTYTTSRWWFQILFISIPIPGEMMQFDEHIFQMG